MNKLTDYLVFALKKMSENVVVDTYLMSEGISHYVLLICQSINDRNFVMVTIIVLGRKLPLNNSFDENAYNMTSF